MGYEEVKMFPDVVAVHSVNRRSGSAVLTSGKELTDCYMAVERWS